MSITPSAKRLVVVEMAGMAISDDPDDVLTTYSLGSCLGVSIYDPQVKIGGLIHCMLPLSSVDPEKARTTPCMFVDTGMHAILTALLRTGVRKGRAVVKVTGGARAPGHSDLFRIGERNYTVLRKILWKNEMLIAAEDVGGQASRTVRLEIASGRCFVQSRGATREL